MFKRFGNSQPTEESVSAELVLANAAQQQIRERSDAVLSDFWLRSLSEDAPIDDTCEQVVALAPVAFLGSAAVTLSGEADMVTAVRRLFGDPDLQASILSKVSDLQGINQEELPRYDMEHIRALREEIKHKNGLPIASLQYGEMVQLVFAGALKKGQPERLYLNLRRDQEGEHTSALSMFTEKVAMSPKYNWNSLVMRDDKGCMYTDPNYSSTRSAILPESTTIYPVFRTVKGAPPAAQLQVGRQFEWLKDPQPQEGGWIKYFGTYHLDSFKLEQIYYNGDPAQPLVTE